METRASHRRTWLFGLAMLARGTHNLSDVTSNAAVAAEGFTNFTPVAVLASGRDPEFYISKFGRHICIAIIGARGTDHYAAMNRQFNSGAKTPSVLGTPQEAYDASRRVVTEFDLMEKGSWDHCFVFGHSYGGFLAPSVLGSIMSSNPSKQFTMVSYGMPKHIFTGRNAHFDLADCACVSTKDDAVPFLPPSSGEDPSIHSALTHAQSTYWNSLSHIGTRYTIDEAGIVNEGAFALTGPVNAFARVIGYLGGASLRLDDTHHFHAYWRMMNRVTLPSVPPIVFSPGHGGVSPVPPIAVPSIATPEVIAAAGEVVYAASGPLRPLPVLPAAYLYRVVRGPVFYSVLLGSLTVATFRRSRAARLYARAGNRFLRQHYKTGAVDPIASGSAYSGFLDTLP